jgi:hypothetical protein
MTRSDYEEFVVQCELAGVLSEAGNFDRPYQGRQFRAPVILGNEDGFLLWRWEDKVTSNPLRPEAHGFGLLCEFMNLADAPVETILAFARKWGVLEICRHGLPCTHNLRYADTFSGRWCFPLSYNDYKFFHEPILYWHFYARQMRALLNIAVRLKQGMPGLVEDWKVVNVAGLMRKSEVKVLGEELFAAIYGRTVEDDRLYVLKLLDRWLSMGDVRPNLVWDDEHCSVSFDNTLFGMLAMQLMLMISSSGGVAFCSGCGKYYPPKVRRPKVDQRNYCPECGRPAAVRDAQAAKRNRLRASVRDETVCARCGRSGG